MQIFCPYGIIKISSFENTFSAIIAKAYIITALIIATIVANFCAIIPESTINIKYEQIPIINVANNGFNTNFENVKFNFIFFFNDIIAIVNATIWQATDAIAAPLTPICGIGTNIKFKINFTKTPTS